MRQTTQYRVPWPDSNQRHRLRLLGRPFVRGGDWQSGLPAPDDAVQTSWVVSMREMRGPQFNPQGWTLWDRRALYEVDRTSLDPRSHPGLRSIMATQTSCLSRARTHDEPRRAGCGCRTDFVTPSLQARY